MKSVSWILCNFLSTGDRAFLELVDEVFEKRSDLGSKGMAQVAATTAINNLLILEILEEVLTEHGILYRLKCDRSVWNLL